MWKWHCPGNPTLIWEHHSQEMAMESIADHVGAFLRHPCLEIHELVDDGVPCDVPGCTIPYMRKES